MIRINLLPVKAAQKKEKLRGQLTILICSVVVALAGCLVVYLSLANKVDDAKEENQRKQQEISQLQKKIGEVGRFKKMKEELQGKLDVLSKLKEGQTGPVHLLDDLSKSLPEKLWINSFKETSGGIAITGVGLTEETVATFMRELELSPYFKNVELQVVEQVSQDGLKLQKFELTCNAELPSVNSSN